jgi:1-acyl-sn-glycerol-3-phosphate acyltransferase
MIVVANHPAWWDPLTILLLAELFPGHDAFAPMDAAALKQYRIFEPLGCFGVEVGTPAGALAFLRTGEAILGSPSNALWITAQGKFCDPRVRPVELRAGVGHLIRRLNDVVVVPLAVEYPFWQERYPEALAHFGTPIEVGRGRDLSVEAWMARLEAGLTQALDDLSAVAQTQDAARFDALVGGNVGVGGVYDLWRRAKSLFGGPSFAGSHAEAVRALRPEGET